MVACSKQGGKVELNIGAVDGLDWMGVVRRSSERNCKMERREAGSDREGLLRLRRGAYSAAL